MTERESLFSAVSDPFDEARNWIEKGGDQLPRWLAPLLERMIEKRDEPLRHIEDALNQMGAKPFEQYPWPGRLVHRVTSLGAGEMREAARALIACEERERADFDAESMRYIDGIEHIVGSRTTAKLVVAFIRDGSQDKNLRPMEDAYQALKAAVDA